VIDHTGDLELPIIAVDIEVSAYRILIRKILFQEILHTPAANARRLVRSEACRAGGESADCHEDMVSCEREEPLTICFKVFG